MNWDMAPGKGHGVEMNLALIGLAAVVLVEGAGLFSIDGAIVRSRTERAPSPAL
jgi:hypothetical protein